MGIANERSIESDRAKAFREFGADLATTYLNETLYVDGGVNIMA